MAPPLLSTDYYQRNESVNKKSLKASHFGRIAKSLLRESRTIIRRTFPFLVRYTFWTVY